MLVVRSVEAFAEGRFPNADVRKLRGIDGYRLRVGRWRILFDYTEGVLLVRRVLDRKDAYR